MLRYGQEIFIKEWDKIVSALEYLANPNATLQDIEQVFNSMQKCTPLTLQVFTTEFWDMIAILRNKQNLKGVK